MISDQPVNEMSDFCNAIFLKSITMTFLFI